MKSRITSLFLSGATALALLPVPAMADLVSTGGGNPDVVPLYRALAFGTINFGNNGGAINGIDYYSNTAPLPLANGSTFISANGASMSTTGASAYAGWYAGRNYAGISVTNANAADTYYEVAGQGSATSVRFFDPSAQAAYATFTWHVSGTTSNPSNITPGCVVDFVNCFPTATGRLDFGATTDQSVSWIDLFSNPTGPINAITRFGTGTFTYMLPIANLGDEIDLYYWSSAFAQVNPGNVPAGSNFTLTANYYNTVVLESVQLFDGLNNPITDWTLQDTISGENVFDETGRLAAVTSPPDLPEAVPEPATLALLGFGLAGLGFSRRRK